METFEFIECINTWQGEGPDAGKRMLLVRFKECNMNCYYCDTKIKMKASYPANYTLTQIQSIIDKNKSGLMITGGEPTFGKQLDQTIELLNSIKYSFANVETNGYGLNILMTSVLSNRKIKYIYSPKIFNEKQLSMALNTFNICMKKDLYIKLVITENDIEEGSLIRKFIELILDSNPNINPNFYLMPEGTTREKLIKNSGVVFDLCDKYKLNFSSRLHLIYNFI